MLSVVTTVFVRTSHTRIPLSSAHELKISSSFAMKLAVLICDALPAIAYGSASGLFKSYIRSNFSLPPVNNLPPSFEKFTLFTMCLC